MPRMPRAAMTSRVFPELVEAIEPESRFVTDHRHRIDAAIQWRPAAGRSDVNRREMLARSRLLRGRDEITTARRKRLRHSGLEPACSTGNDKRHRLAVPIRATEFGAGFSVFRDPSVRIEVHPLPIDAWLELAHHWALRNIEHHFRAFDGTRAVIEPVESASDFSRDPSDVIGVGQLVESR